MAALAFFCTSILNFCAGVRVAVKAMQKGKITDYESFQNEINILMNLVSLAQYTAIRSMLLNCLWLSHGFISQTIQHLVCLIQLSFRITPTSSSSMRPGKQTEFASSSQSKVQIICELAFSGLANCIDCYRLCEGGELFFFIT